MLFESKIKIIMKKRQLNLDTQIFLGKTKTNINNLINYNYTEKGDCKI